MAITHRRRHTDRVDLDLNVDLTAPTLPGDEVRHALGEATSAPTSRGAILDLCDQPLPEPDIHELHDRWGTTSRIRLGLSRQQWHHPATRDVTDAIASRADLTDALRRFGEARADAGLSLDETLSDLDVLAELVPEDHRSDLELGVGRVDTLRAASVAGTAWAEAFYDQVVAPSCIDTMTGLVTGTYLQARLEQRYRQHPGTGRRVSDETVLVVLQIQCRDLSPFACIAKRIKAAADLRAAFPYSDTIAVLEPTHAMVVLADNGPHLANDVALLKARCPSDAVWVERLPDSAADAQSLALELATIPRIATIAHGTDVRHP